MVELDKYGYRIDGKFLCCKALRYTPNRFVPHPCPICKKEVQLCDGYVDVLEKEGFVSGTDIDNITGELK